jgi:hypothetical protein
MIQKVFLLFFSLIFNQLVVSQTYEDVVRYNSFNHEGTSRFNSMGGAFGALGADLSAISINPASSSVFLDSEISITLKYKNQKLNNNFNNFKSNSTNDLFSYGGSGIVLVYENRKSKFSIAYNNNILSDFNSSYSLSGKNNYGIDNYFLYYADGIPYEDLQIYENETTQSVYDYLGNNFGFADQQAFLGFQSYIINQSGDDSTNYVSNSEYDILNQDLDINRTGNHLKHSVNFATSFKNYIFTGININLHETHFEEVKVFNENGYLNNSNVNRVLFKEDLLALGRGVSFQIGTIIKIKQLRFGLSYNTSTILKVEEENIQYIESVINDQDGLTKYEIDPNTVNIYDEYELSLPSKSLFSLAYIFGKKGLLSFDYEITKFNNSKFDDNNGKDSYLNSLNNTIENKLAGHSESFRFGGEYRIKNLNLRAGYFSYKGPDSSLDNKISGVSAGLGLNYDYMEFDIGITKSNNYNQNRLYSKGLINKYSIDKNILSLYASFTIKI